MFDALKARLNEIVMIKGKAIPRAAIAIADKIRNDVHANKRAAGKRRSAAIRDLRTGGLSAKEARLRVGQGRRGSGISILAVASDTEIRVTASNQVQHIARENGEPSGWIEILADEVRKAGAPR